MLGHSSSTLKVPLNNFEFTDGRAHFLSWYYYPSYRRYIFLASNFFIKHAEFATDIRRMWTSRELIFS